MTLFIVKQVHQCIVMVFTITNSNVIINVICMTHVNLLTYNILLLIIITPTNTTTNTIIISFIIAFRAVIVAIVICVIILHVLTTR